MIKVGRLDKSTNYGRIMGEYFKISPPGIFVKWQNLLFDENISQAERDIRYNLLKNDIAKLKILFKERTKELNKMAQEEGFSNYLEAYLTWNQIPREKYEAFLKNIDNFISLVMSDDVPIRKLMEREKDWNMFNTPYPLGNQWPNDKFEIPNQVFGLLVAYDQRALKYKYRLDIKYDKDVFYTITKYNAEKNIVEIKIKNGEDDIYQVLGFVDALGLAFEMLDMANKGEKPEKISKYISKQVMTEYGLQFLKHYVSVNHQKVLRYNTLSIIAMTLFEIDIFTNDEQDYDKAYAKAINRCYPMSHQIENPFYIYYQGFLIRPMGELVSAMVDIELYLKDAESSPNVL